MVIASLSRMMNAADCAPWGASVGRRYPASLARPDGLLDRIEARGRRMASRPLYTQEQRRLRDATPWTMVQGVLAPLQFAVFLVSVALVGRFLITGQGEAVADASVILKTLVLYTIMVTGAFWERAVFGRYLFAPAFFWEDAVSMVVIALHTLYLFALATAALDPHRLALLALGAYGTYLVNATQFVLKLRAARLAAPSWSDRASGGGMDASGGLRPV